MTPPPTTSTGAATPGDYLLYADSYWLAAKRLFNAQPLPGIPLPGLEAHHLLPGLTLVCICIELTLKAFLVQHKFDESKLKKAIGHSLKQALVAVSDLSFFDHCEELAMAKVEDDIAYLDGIYNTTLLKYPQAPREFRGKPDYLELAQFLLRGASKFCSVTELRSLVEPAFDGPQFGRITNCATSGAGRHVMPAKTDGGQAQ